MVITSCSSCSSWSIIKTWMNGKGITQSTILKNIAKYLITAGKSKFETEIGFMIHSCNEDQGQNRTWEI
jgi:hypothetical protein